MIAPDTAPYSEEEAFRVGNYQIVDVSDSVIVGGEGDNFVEIVDGKAVMTVPMDGIDNAADQLLCWFQESRPTSKISGNWECNFTI